MTNQQSKEDIYIHTMLGSSTQREKRIEHIFRSLDAAKSGQVSTESLVDSFRNQYNLIPNTTDKSVEHIVSTIPKSNTGYVSFEEFKSFMTSSEKSIAESFKNLDTKLDGRLDLDEVYDGLDGLGLEVDPERVQMFFNLIDIDGDGFISYDEWVNFLLFVPHDSIPLLAAYDLFIEEMDLSPEGDFFLSSETLNGLGYFLAGGFAGVVSRTCTAPFDRIKVYLIAQSGQPLKKTAAETIAKTTTEVAPTFATRFAQSTVVRAFKHIWSQGGIRSFFVGNGLNVIKVFPESAMKFGSFETAKRFLAGLEGKSDTAEISRASTFLAGGFGGVVAQFTVYPIDTLKFRIQCESLSASVNNHGIIFKTIKSMWNEGGIRMFYRGIGVGILGIFPFAAFDLGTFSAMKKAYVARRAVIEGIDESEVKLGNLVVLSMGASSGCVGASLVYPVNLLRTRLQAQGTHAHPYRYTGFMDVYRKTIARDGYKGLWRGLAPNLAKVAPAVSISYLVYENSKALLGLS